MSINNSAIPMTESKVVVDTVCPVCGEVVERVLDKRFTDSQDAWKSSNSYVITCTDKVCHRIVSDIEVIRTQNMYDKKLYEGGCNGE